MKTIFFFEKETYDHSFNAHPPKHQITIVDEYLTNVFQSISTVQVSFVQPEYGHAK